MNRRLTWVVALVISLSTSACILDFFKDRNGKFQSNPVNLTKFNSEWDDYNSNLPQNKYGRDFLIFSSKRERKTLFNLVYKQFELTYNDKTNVLSATDKWASDPQKEYAIELLTRAANGEYNVLGPILIREWNFKPTTSYAENKFVLLYADDSRGDLQIKFVHNLNKWEKVEGPFEIPWLNSPQDDAYPTFDTDFTKLYFCSNRDGNFDIYEADLPADKTKLIETLQSKALLKVTKNEQLSSPADDKCPFFPINFLYSTVMYLVSNRSGGFGGFDIYYTKISDGKWSTPTNMGNRVNSAYDEYRPITFPNTNFNYHLGLFSSNRPGGLGGFDLYMAGFLQSKELRP